MAVIEARDRLAPRKQALPSKAFIALACISVAVLPSGWTSDAPAVRFTPNAHDFGTHDIGTTAKVSFALENQGKLQLNLQSISIQGSNPDFFVVQNDCPRSLAAKKTYTVVVPSTNAMASGNFRILPWPFLTDKYDSRTLSSERRSVSRRIPATTEPPATQS